jgi:hypothetical protein
MKMKRIFLSVVAAFAIFGASFAINQPKPVLAEFTVTGQDATHYTVSTTPDPDCGESGAQVCRITTSASPDAQNRILKTQATASGWKPE